MNPVEKECDGIHLLWQIEIQLKHIISRPVNIQWQSEGGVSPHGSSLQEFKV